MPDNSEPCIERRYFADVHYLALVCSDDVLASRLRGRPEWRQTHAPEYVSRQIAFNQWFKGRQRDLTPAVELLDTTSEFIGYAHLGVELGSRAAVDALTKRLQGDGFPLLDGPRRTGDGYYESMVADPEGNRIVIAE